MILQFFYKEVIILYREIYQDIEVNRDKRAQFYTMEEPHNHRVYEIYYLNSGSRKFFMEGEIFTVSKGDLVFIDKNLMHQTTYISDKAHERTYVLFKEKYIESIAREYGSEGIESCLKQKVFTIPPARREYIENLLNQLEREYKNKDMYSKRLMECYINELLLFLIRYVNTLGSEFSKELKGADEIMEKAAKFIMENYKNDISLSDVAEFVNMSSTYFSKRFKETTGVGFKEFLLNIRIKKASLLLLESKMKITEVAYSCGFNDSNYFGDVFKRFKGLSPLQYRNSREKL